jgi:trk system potassium uptake protein TrkA
MFKGKKFIIIGLGNFGTSLGEKLTKMGHEVIGVDNRMSKVELFKEKLTHTICLNCTDQHAIESLPLKETDIVLVTIGEDEGANIITTALIKQVGVKRLISRAISPIHETILAAMGVDEILHPEEETASRWAKKLIMGNVIDSFELPDHHNIVEILVPKEFVGKTLSELSLLKNYNLIVLTTIIIFEEKSLLGLPKKTTRVKGVATSETILNDGEIMVIYGHIKDIEKLLKDYK